MDRKLMLPTDFGEYAWLLESKGYFTDALVRVGQQDYPVTFYDPTRLAQDIAEELAAGRSFWAARLIVVPALTEEAMHSAVASAPREWFE